MSGTNAREIARKVRLREREAIVTYLENLSPDDEVAPFLMAAAQLIREGYHRPDGGRATRYRTYVDFPICPSCSGPVGLSEDCRNCRLRLKIAIGRMRLAGHWRDFKRALRELIR